MLSHHFTSELLTLYKIPKPFSILSILKTSPPLPKISCQSRSRRRTTKSHSGNIAPAFLSKECDDPDHLPYPPSREDSDTILGNSERARRKCKEPKCLLIAEGKGNWAIMHDIGPPKHRQRMWLDTQDQPIEWHAWPLMPTSVCMWKLLGKDESAVEKEWEKLRVSFLNLFFLLFLRLANFVLRTGCSTCGEEGERRGGGAEAGEK